MKLYCCGYCGGPTDSKGNPESIFDNYSPNGREMVHGLCCVNEVMYEEERYVTHEMAMDAQDPTLEDQPY